MTVLDQSTHVTHNFFPLPPDGTETSKILTASYEGVSQIDVPRERKAGTQETIGTRMLLHPGNQQNPASNRAPVKSSWVNTPPLTHTSQRSSLAW